MATGKVVGYNSLHVPLSMQSVPFASIGAQPFVERARERYRAAMESRPKTTACCCDTKVVVCDEI
tara:strand:- start:17 stop:211 length:195 start_codon:yes stop_codon:yes gene_type:complete